MQQVTTTPDEERANIVQQLTDCLPATAEKVVRRLAEYEAVLPVSDPVLIGYNRFDTSTQTAAVLCGVVKHTFLKYAAEHPEELPYLAIGNKFRFRRADINAFLKRRLQGSK
jgi:excisionase family DNA binding protein